jgi:hypothetical protein
MKCPKAIIPQLGLFYLIERKTANLHKIGNLLITYDNSALSNKEFNIKRDLYKKSKLLVENEVAKKTRWDDSDINIRTQELLHFAFKRWELKTK